MASPPRVISSQSNNRPEIDSFYHLTTTNVSGEVCQGTACFVARRLNPSRWQQAESQEPRVYCLGKCYAAPATGAGAERPIMEIRSRQGTILNRVASGGARTLESYVRQGGYQALDRALKQPAEEIILAIEHSGLRGLGGAGFPTGRKWRSVAEVPAPRKFVIANFDEGDPGAYIDRFLVEDDPHALIEALAIAAYAVGAGEGYVYVRNEYPRAKSILREALTDARREGFLGQRILSRDFSFDVEIHSGRGSYVCGEETALLDSIEGKRPEVRARPPFPAQQGLFGLPTLVQNVETLANVPWIVLHGGDAFQRLGFSKSRGNKVVSLNSLFARPGLYEVEFGVPLRHIVEDLGGGLRSGSLKGLIVGGPLAGIVPPHLLDTPFGFEELQHIHASVGHGGMVAFDEHTSIPELVHHVFSFGAYESCGKCTPCREGSRDVEQIFGRILKQGTASQAENRQCTEALTALRLTSLCGLGTGLAEFAESARLYYAAELEPCFK
jgi:NADH:ubiquinone oxidoreductase subunit F (NADH-binding)